jgi:hypothetical protein
MFNLDNKKALSVLGGIKGLRIANTRSLNSEQYGTSNGGKSSLRY